MPLSHEQILFQYNSVFRGITNYYSFTHNYNHLISTLTHFLKGSCAKLLAAKFTLKTQAKVYKKFGSLLTSPKGAKFIKPKYGITLKFNTNIKDNITSLFVKEKSIASLDKLSCVACGSSYRVEMHHVRAMKDLECKTDFIDRLMIKAKRKQIPLCRKCHMKKHSGRKTNEKNYK
jgi:Type II intron maturase